MVIVRSGPMRFFVAGAAILMLLNGCAVEQQTSYAETERAIKARSLAVAAQMQADRKLAKTDSARVVQVQVDEFTKETTYSGPPTQTFETTPAVAKVITQLHATQKGPNTDYALLINIMRTGHSFLGLQAALDADAQPLSLSVGSQYINGCTSNHCTYTENVIVHLTRSYLQGHAGSGLRIRVQGNGRQIVEVPAEDVALFLEKVPVN